MDANTQILEEEIMAEEDGASPQTGGFNVLTFVQSNGWFILISALLLYYLWKEKISPYIIKWQKAKEDEKISAHMKKDPDFYAAREEARLAAVQRLQNKYNEEAVKMKQIAEEKEEKKRQEYISRLSNIFPGRKLNEEYSPLMGKGGPSYKAPKRSCPGGSCGNR